MANDVSSRQWHFDTPVPFGQANAIVWPANFKCLGMEWTGFTAAAQQAIIKDRNGKIVWSPQIGTTLTPERLTRIGWVEGLVIDTLPAGVITVYVE